MLWPRNACSVAGWSRWSSVASALGGVDEVDGATGVSFRARRDSAVGARNEHEVWREGYTSVNGDHRRRTASAAPTEDAAVTREPDPNDPFSRINYRSLIAWPDRIEREWPFLEWGLAAAPERSVIDLGCGTGEHARYLAARGFRTVGIDQSTAQIEKAREYENESGKLGPHFLNGDMLDLPRLTRERFGAAICLGNVLPYMEDADLTARLGAIAQVVLPGGRLLLQILNYERILAGRVRHLPINFRPDPANGNNEIVWVRLICHENATHVMFYPITLALRPGEDPPVEIASAREIRLRAWVRPELEELLDRSGFTPMHACGDMQRTPYDASMSSDLILVAGRR